MTNCAFLGNSVDYYGGGMYNHGSSSSVVTNCTFSSNSAGWYGGGMLNRDSSSVVTNSILWGDGPDEIYKDYGGESVVTYSDIQGGYCGDGNIDTDPLFVDPGSGDYHLADTSPAIGAGKADGAPSTDIEGNPRPNPAGSKPDMGAYEHPLGPPPLSTFKVYLPFMHNASRSAEGSLYFVAGDILYQMNLDGSDLRGVANGLQGNEALAVDPIHRKVYAGVWVQPAQMQVYDMDTRGLAVFSDGPGDGGTGLAIDPVAHKMVRGLYHSGVYMMDMNTVGNWTQLVDSASLYPMHGQGGQIALDPANRHIYFRGTNNYCESCRRIWRVNYDGSSLTQIIPANGGDALALDLTERKMYFSDEYPYGTVKRANLDGSAVETLLTLPTPYRMCRETHLDVDDKKMYLLLENPDSNYTERAIARANMDGSEFEILHTMAGNTDAEVHGLMVLYLPTTSFPEPPLLVRYDFEGDFTASGTVLDRSGNGHNAQVTGAVARTTGISGSQGIAFTGNGYLQATSNPAAGKTDVTFSLWFKTEHPEENSKLASGAWWNWAPAPVGS